MQVQYNYDFEIASLIVMVIVFLHFAFVRQFPSDKTRVYGMLILSCMFECIFNIASSVGLANAAFIPQVVNEVVTFAFFVFEGLSSYLIFCYFAVQGELGEKSKRPVWILGTLPFVLFEFFVILTPFIGFFYYFWDGVYYQGFGANFGYWYVICYFVLNLAYIAFRRKVIGKRMKLIVLIYTAVAVVMIAVQYHIRGILMTSVGNTIVLLMIYLAMQNPNEMIDPVTEIGNESALLQQIKNRLYQTKGLIPHTAEFAVITVRIRKMHHLNDLLGIENRNAILQDIGSYLYLLGGKFHVFHNPDDMFTVIVDSVDRSREIRDQIADRFRKDWGVQQNRIVLDIAMIIQYYPGDFKTVPDYIGMRNFLLEEAENAGSGVAVESSSELADKYWRRNKVELVMERAIREKTFQVYYQPIYSLKEKRIVSLEALVRLQDEELGFISPDEFIPLAERDGSIIAIGAIVLEECCRFLAHHVLSNASLGIRTIQVNLSMVQCMCQNLAETILPVLEKYHIPPSMITLEVTEGAALTTPEQMQYHMKELGGMGITFAMDDYGSGNSNCSYLIRFPFREVKIDKEIVWAYFDNPVAQVVLENEIRTIRKLQIPLVVEGIEKIEQSQIMEKLGVDYIQGYYYGKPMPEQECLRHVRQFNAAAENYA